MNSFECHRDNLYINEVLFQNGILSYYSNIDLPFNYEDHSQKNKSFIVYTSELSFGVNTKSVKIIFIYWLVIQLYEAVLNEVRATHK